MLFGLAHELHRPVAEIEGLSNRELQGWIRYFRATMPAAPKRDVSELSPAELAQLLGKPV